MCHVLPFSGRCGARGGASARGRWRTAKAALAALTKSWAKALAPYNILVNAVSPGLVITSMTLAKAGMALVEERSKVIPVGHYAQPREIAYTVAFLASSEADFFTGQVLSPNGGEIVNG